MKLSVGDKVKYKGEYVCYWGVKGTIVRECQLIAECKIVKFRDGYERHVFIRDMELALTKNQQLVFEFME